MEALKIHIAHIWVYLSRLPCSSEVNKSIIYYWEVFDTRRPYIFMWKKQQQHKHVYSWITINLYVLQVPFKTVSVFRYIDHNGQSYTHFWWQKLYHLGRHMPTYHSLYKGAPHSAPRPGSKSKRFWCIPTEKFRSVSLLENEVIVLLAQEISWPTYRFKGNCVSRCAGFFWQGRNTGNKYVTKFI